MHVSETVVPYEATFGAMSFCHRRIWEYLTTRPPTKRRCASLALLMKERPHERFVIAASPVYLRAIEEDLYVGSKILTCPDQLMIVTSKGYKGCLSEHISLTTSAMMSMLNTNMTGLNIS